VKIDNVILYIFLFLNLLIYAQEKDSTFNIIKNIFDSEDYTNTINFGKKNIKRISKNEVAHTYFLIGKSYENLNKEDSAFAYYQYALKDFKLKNAFEDVANLNLQIYLLLSGQNNLKIDRDKYFDEFYDYAKKTNSKKWLAAAYNNLGIENFENKNINIPKKYFLDAFNLYEALDSIHLKVQVLSNLGVLYSQRVKNLDSARYYYYKALSLLDKDSSKTKNINSKFNLLNNLGNTFRKEGKYKKAIEVYKKAELINLKKYALNSKKMLYSNIDESYYYLKDYKNAYHYLYKYDSIKDVISLKDQNTLISDIQEKYDNEKLRADNLEIESKRKQNFNLLIGALSFILFGGITAFLIQKNTRKKQKLAEQEKALETQKLATVLKEQELVSIDAMIEGQEIERQRIANDLHDDLGGLMATIKLHFNSLKDTRNFEIFDKTNNLLDEAYTKVRTIAHAKNSGVIAKQGLLKAVQNMADKVSASNQIKIDVVDHGLEDRLENSLELTIFRIIQELISNIIKHAEATEAIVHLTNHRDSLNIMVEDNGKGFDQKQITAKNKGMGISSIDKRVEHLNGALTIESELNKGTTIIIDIPL
jgi:signal transduction histidine kinase